jgi:phosphohistidine phosphatase
MELLLIRHAIAHDRDSERWPDDADRPLTARGVQRLQRAARGLRQLVPHVDLLLTSPYRRARETADILCEHARWPAATVEGRLGGGQPAEAMAVAFGSLIQGSTVAAVGHEPQLSQMLGVLTGNGRGVALDWRRGGVARLAADAPAIGRWRLLAFLPPRVLRDLEAAARG